jgi:hypothetical protein
MLLIVPACGARAVGMEAFVAQLLLVVAVVAASISGAVGFEESIRSQPTMVEANATATVALRLNGLFLTIPLQLCVTVVESADRHPRTPESWQAVMQPTDRSSPPTPVELFYFD